MRRRAYNPVKIQPNLTSMVDVVFLLVVFFMLITQLNKEQFIEMILPRLRAPTTEPIDADRRIVVNVMPVAHEAGTAVLAGVPDRTGRYRVSGIAFDATPDGVTALARTIREAAAREPSARVIVRAARDERYEIVHPALQAVTLAGVSRVDLVALPDDARSSPASAGEGGG